ncbi:MAG: hypothetical protein ACRCW1_05895, partial [Anaerotignaceae bacterium]
QVTHEGRRILNTALKWAEFHQFKIINADTDSISFSSNKIINSNYYLEDLNKSFDMYIKWEDDGYYKKIIVVAAKNYIMVSDKVTIKGSSLKATTKEKALKRYINEVIDILIEGNNNALLPHYESYVRQICNIKDIKDWCSKKTITKKVLDPKRTNESRVLDAVSDIEGLQEGDKVYVFFKTDKELCTADNFDGKYSKKKLFEKLYKTVKIFESVIDTTQFKNYALVKNQKLLEQTQIDLIENRIC